MVSIGLLQYRVHATVQQSLRCLESFDSGDVKGGSPLPAGGKGTNTNTSQVTLFFVSTESATLEDFGLSPLSHSSEVIYFLSSPS